MGVTLVDITAALFGIQYFGLDLGRLDQPMIPEGAGAVDHRSLRGGNC